MFSQNSQVNFNAMLYLLSMLLLYYTICFHSQKSFAYKKHCGKTQKLAFCNLKRKNAVFAFANSDQTTLFQGNFANITFDKAPTLVGWKSANLTDFIAGEAGVYLVKFGSTIVYTGLIAGPGDATVTMRAILNGIEIPGSQIGNFCGGEVLILNLSKSFIFSCKAGDTFNLQFTTTKNPPNFALVNLGSGSIPISVTFTITKIL